MQLHHQALLHQFVPRARCIYFTVYALQSPQALHRSDPPLLLYAAVASFILLYVFATKKKAVKCKATKKGNESHNDTRNWKRAPKAARRAAAWHRRMYAWT